MLGAESHEARMVRLLLDAVCQVYDLTPEDVLRPDRTLAVAEARQVYAYLLLRDAGLTCVEAGRVMRRDHSSVLHGVARIERLSGEAWLQTTLHLVRWEFARLNRQEADAAHRQMLTAMTPQHRRQYAGLVAYHKQQMHRREVC